MNETPMSMAEVDELVQQANAAGKNVTADDIITSSLLDWADFLLAEGLEGSYFSAHLQGQDMTITDVAGAVVATITTPETDWLAAFKKAPRQTVLAIQSALRHKIDTHEIAL